MVKTIYYYHKHSIPEKNSPLNGEPVFFYFFYFFILFFYIIIF
jgi:hypothetical protein